MTIYLVYESPPHKMVERCWIVPDIRAPAEAYIRVEGYLKRTGQTPLNADDVYYLEVATIPQLVDEDWDYK